MSSIFSWIYLCISNCRLPSSVEQPFYLEWMSSVFSWTYLCISNSRLLFSVELIFVSRVDFFFHQLNLHSVSRNYVFFHSWTYLCIRNWFVLSSVYLTFVSGIHDFFHKSNLPLYPDLMFPFISWTFLCISNLCFHFFSWTSLSRMVSSFFIGSILHIRVEVFLLQWIYPLYRKLVYSQFS